MPNKMTKIGIIGLGYVGSAVKRWFASRKDRYTLFLYDKYKRIGTPEDVNKADIIFVAVPTPFHVNGIGYDDSEVRDALKTIKNGKIIVLKSTILPGSTEKFQKRYPKKTILFNPEFLRARTAFSDFVHPDRQIVGYANIRGKKVAPDILRILPRAQTSEIIRAREAEMVKYFGNTFLAVRVIFANQIYDLCKKLGIDYEIVKEHAGRDRRIGHSHFDVLKDGYRGYGGACLPKDTKALIQLADETGISLDLLKLADAINKKLVKTKINR